MRIRQIRSIVIFHLSVHLQLEYPLRSHIIHCCVSKGLNYVVVTSVYFLRIK